MTDKHATYTYFLESKEKMKPLLEGLFANNEEINPNNMKPIPSTIDKNNKVDISSWIWDSRGFHNYDEQAYFVHDVFSVVMINTNGFAAKLFTDFANKNNLSYFSKLRNDSFYYFKNINENFEFNVDFKSINDNIDVLSCIDLSKIGIITPIKFYEEKFNKKEGLIFSRGNSFYNKRLKFESDTEQQKWLDFEKTSTNLKNLDELNKLESWGNYVKPVLPNKENDW